MRRIAFVLPFVAATVVAWPALALDVLVSINPLHSLVSAVMGETGKPVLLLEGASDPHTFSLRPSDAKALKRAQVVFLAGAGLEAFLDKPLRSLGKATTVVKMAEIPGITRLEAREGGLWEEDEEEHGQGHGHEHGHGHHDTVDPHLWLDPANARIFVLQAGEVLAQADPDQAASYRANAKATAQRLDALDAELAQTLKSAQNVPYLVFHDAFQYLDHRYGLKPAGAVSIEPERQPGAKRIKAIRKRLTDGGVACVLRQPQFSPKLIDSLVSGLSVRQGVLDDLGASIPAGPDAYGLLLRSNAAALVGCVSG